MTTLHNGSFMVGEFMELLIVKSLASGTQYSEVMSTKVRIKVEVKMRF